MPSTCQQPSAIPPGALPSRCPASWMRSRCPQEALLARGRMARVQRTCWPGHHLTSSPAPCHRRGKQAPRSVPNSRDAHQQLAVPCVARTPLGEPPAQPETHSPTPIGDLPHHPSAGFPTQPPRARRPDCPQTSAASVLHRNDLEFSGGRNTASPSHETGKGRLRSSPQEPPAVSISGLFPWSRPGLPRALKNWVCPEPTWARPRRFHNVTQLRSPKTHRTAAKQPGGPAQPGLTSSSSLPLRVPAWMCRLHGDRIPGSPGSICGLGDMCGPADGWF